MESTISAALALTALLSTSAAAQRQPVLEDPPIEYLSPEASLMRFQLPPGYHLQLVAAEPTIAEPVMCVFDGDGRMYVAEMRTYMQDIDGTGTKQPTSRVSRLEDRDGDGVFEHRTVFADHLVLPRMLLPLDDRVIIKETYSGILWCYRDTDGDGCADDRQQLYAGEDSKANLEHQDSALTWGLDNWLYTAMGEERYRIRGQELIVEEIDGAFAQWGLAQDDHGRLFFSAAGGERAAFDFHQHPQYGRLTLDGGLAEDFELPWPIVALDDVQGGTKRLREDGTLNHFTGCCGQSIFRGDRLPTDLYGDYILCEPVGRLIRRATIDSHAGKLVLSNHYDQREFIASTDVNFRPVWTTTGPDGCLYIVDMYRGIIQEGNWVREGSYLRPVVRKHGLDAFAGRGRIYRLQHADHQPGPQPRMLSETTAELVGHLAHPNGWWRSTAQKLLVLRGDRSVVPAVTHVAAKCPDPRGRIHALWTLDGLGALNRKLASAALRDPDPQVRRTAIWINERWLRTGHSDLLADLRGLAKDPSPEVIIQLVQSLRYLPGEPSRDLIIDIMLAHPHNELLQRAGNDSLDFGKPTSDALGHADLDVDDLQLLRSGGKRYRQLCIACHGEDGRGTPAGPGLTLAPPLDGSPRVLRGDAALIRIVLQGMTGPIDERHYPGAIMAPLATHDDDWLASVLTYVRNSWSNRAPVVTSAAVAHVRSITAARSTPWTFAEIQQFMPIDEEALRSFRWTASHNPDALSKAFDGDSDSRYTTEQSQNPGMWIAVDFGTAYQLDEIVLDTRGSRRDYPRAWSVRCSGDGQTWDEVQASGKGNQAITTIRLPEGTTTQHLRIDQTGEVGGLWWSIHELRIVGRPAGG